jgi:hypothetical protein
MTLLLKDPEAALDYSVDWATEYLSGETLVQSDWRVAPVEPGGLSVVASRFDTGVATATAAAGVRGHLYQLTNHVVLSSGRTDSRSIVLRVEKR